MKQHLIHCLFLIAGTWLFEACKPVFNVQSLQPETTFSPKLPKLVPVLDRYSDNQPVNNLSLHYLTVGDSLAAIRRPVVLQPFTDSLEYRKIRTSYFQNANADWFNVYFARDVERNLCVSDGPSNGNISCNVTAFDSRPINMAGRSIVYGAMLGLPILLGAPTVTWQSSMEIEVTIRNRHGQQVATYWGVANIRKHSGLYYGYRLEDVEQFAQLEAFKTALGSVKKQIDANHDHLVRTLEK